MYLGIDFSGGAAPWRARCARPSVWIARVEDKAGGGFRLVDLRAVQDLSGAAAPFERLAALLREGDFATAAIDAPFAIPAEYWPTGGHAALLARVAALPVPSDRPFPAGASLIELATEVMPLRQAKPLRATERTWAARGVNTRSILWNGPRGGAPFAAACLALLARSGRPIWPWNAGRGMLAEAFPAAQLKTWGLPHDRYGRPDQQAARTLIVAELARRMAIGDAHLERMLVSADALDAVLASFGAIAAYRSGPPFAHPADGWIGVLDAAQTSAVMP